MKKLLLIALVVCTMKMTAQATASFTASVTIIQPIGITTTSHMNFANVDAKTGGAIILTPGNTRLTSGGVELDNASNVSAATFEIRGEQGFAFTLSLPKNEQVLTNGRESMIIKDFTSNLGSGGQIASESKIIRVGATLDVNPYQTPGIYTSPAPMTITVNYN